MLLLLLLLLGVMSTQVSALPMAVTAVLEV
jgi:hypothetical protein